MPRFEVVSEYNPSGDQPQAIEALSRGIEMGLDEQTLLGVTGSGKTFTMAKIIEQVQRPTLVLAHNKTLAAQLCAEFREFFSPQRGGVLRLLLRLLPAGGLYPPHTDTFIEKDSAINEEIDRLRLSATASLLERRDVIVVSSVSCIYGLGEPEDFASMMVSLRVGATLERDELLKKLVAIRYERNDIAFERNAFRVRGTPWRCGLPTGRTRPCGSSSSGTRSTASARSTWSPAPHPPAEQHPHLAGHPLCHPQGEDGRRYPGDLQGTGGAGGRLRGRGQAGGGTAAEAAHHVRRGDDAGAWLLLRHRELFPGH